MRHFKALDRFWLAKVEEVLRDGSVTMGRYTIKACRRHLGGNRRDLDNWRVLLKMVPFKYNLYIHNDMKRRFAEVLTTNPALINKYDLL
ncbi:MAG: hypothetical protein D6746_08615 [Bacteroidetes bacterium]|nr:MAG: hypothetical protein D6746_08615 [Bacteroidota bacterium]